VKRILIAVVRFVLALALLFLTVGLVWTLFALPMPLDRNVAFWPAVLGFAIGLALFTVGSRFLTLYVFGHELTHWLVAKCFLRETGKFSVGSSGGSVAVERPNVWIVLAPYFVPVYTLIWIAAYGVYRIWAKQPDMSVLQVFYGGVGFTYAFHTVLTGHSVSREQKDLRLYGRFFSLALILFCNAGLLFGALLAAGREWRSGISLLFLNLEAEWLLLAQLCERLPDFCGL